MFHRSSLYLWPDLRKGVFHTHAILVTWKTVTWLSNNKWSWNFFQPLSYVGTFCWPNFKSVACANLKLWIVKVGKLDVCGRPLFANPVTNYEASFWMIFFWNPKPSWSLIYSNCMTQYYCTVQLLPYCVMGHICTVFQQNVLIVFTACCLHS